jgi:type II restriction enzyme
VKEDIASLLNCSTFTSKSKSTQALYIEILKLLRIFGIPVNQTPRRLEKTVGAFISLCDIKKLKEISSAKDLSSPRIQTTREIITWENTHLEEQISSGSYDDIRRKDLKLLVVADVVLKSSPNSATNDSTRGYGANPIYVDLIRKYYGKPNWESAIKESLKSIESLEQRLLRRRDLERMPVSLPNGQQVQLTSGEHNVLQKLIIEEFLPIYGYGSEVLYIGDTADKYLLKHDQMLAKLGFPEFSHDELPDIVCYSRTKDWIYLIEAVHTSGPISEIRLLQLRTLTRQCKSDIVFVTCFLDMKTFRKYATEIAWETEVWVAERPEHLIHFNGDKFLGPHKPK